MKRVYSFEEDEVWLYGEEDLEEEDEEEDEEEEEDKEQKQSYYSDDDGSSSCEKHIVTKRDLTEFKAFVNQVNANGYKNIYGSWYDQRFGKRLDACKAGLGNQSNNKVALETWDDIVLAAFHQMPIKTHGFCFEYDVCCFCGMKKHCTSSILINKSTYSVANVCIDLSKVVIDFFVFLAKIVLSFDISIQNIQTLLKRMEKIEKYHANKLRKDDFEVE